MSTFEDLEREVAKLRKEVNRLRGNPQAVQRKAVEELTGTNPDEPKGFHAACENSRAVAHTELRDKLVSRLNDLPYITPNDVQEFRWEFKAVHDLESLLSERVASNKVR